MKIKWFNLTVHRSHDELYQAFKSNPFNDAHGWGFSVEKLTTDYIYVKYSEKIKVIEDVIDPYGKISYLEYDKYVYFNFYLFKMDGFSYPLIIESAPRSIKNFISNMESIIESRVRLEVRNFDIKHLIGNFSDKFGFFDIKSIKVKNLVISKYTSGNIELVSSKDALADLNDYFNEPKYSIDKIKISISDSIFDNTFEINSTGSIITTEDEIEKIYPLFL
ncbi:MAG: hypothetical protein LBE28_00805 [Providencia alcalifaciens]|jgi:hypothetical protein|nr:hypothetical protein [Providencia alcalifaciens]